MWLWIKRIIFTLAMTLTLLSSILVIRTDSKASSFMVLNILLLVFPIVNIVLYFIQSAHETQKLSSFARCILFGLECLAYNMGFDDYDIGVVVTFITLIPVFYSIYKYLKENGEWIKFLIVSIVIILVVLVFLIFGIYAVMKGLINS